MATVNDKRSSSVAEYRAVSEKMNKELVKANPAGIIDFFEIDLEDILFDLNIIESKNFNTILSDSERVFRFHNALNLTTKTLDFQGKTYIAAPIQMIEVEYSTKGLLPRPKLGVTTEVKGVPALSQLKSIIAEIGDIVGAKVTRRRTFDKFIDASNHKDLLENIPNHEPNASAILRFDLFYIYKKTNENENTLEYELASSLELDNTPLPGRTILQDKCGFQYRGEGCCYEKALIKNTHGVDKASPPGSVKFQDARPVADLNDLNIVKKNGSLSGYLPPGTVLSFAGQWKKEISPPVSGKYYFVEKNNIRYYFVCILDNPKNVAPPDRQFWVPDQCSKSVYGCSLRFDSFKGLPYGGFAAVRKSK